MASHLSLATRMLSVAMEVGCKYLMQYKLHYIHTIQKVN